jgi:hypothetical protein
MKFNPFRPNSIVAPGMFAGRYDEVTAIERGLHQTRNGNPKHFLIEGERGIGKSSLMLYVDYLSSGRFLWRGIQTSAFWLCPWNLLKTLRATRSSGR